MKDILSEIIANKRFEVDLQKQAISIEQLQEGISEAPTSRSMKQALSSSASGIIAELDKERSMPGRDCPLLCSSRSLRPFHPYRREVFRRKPEGYPHCTPFGRDPHS